MKKGLAIFLGVFFLTAVFQTWVWFTRDYTDMSLWVPAAEIVGQGSLPGADNPVYGYPATTFMIPAGYLVRLGVSPETAVSMTMAALIAFLAATLALVSFRLFPTSPWWMTVASLSGFNLIYTNATPPSALVTLLIPLLCLLTLLAYRQPERWTPYVLLGVFGGFSLATRWDITAVTLAGLLVMVVFRSPGKAVVSGALALISFVGLDPYFYTGPLEHVSTTLLKMEHHYRKPMWNGIAMSLMKSTALGFIGFFFAAVLLVLRKSPLERLYTAWILGLTLLVTGFLLSSAYHPDWYFYPFLMVWELFLPLFLLALLKDPLPFNRQLPRMREKHWSMVIVGLILVGQIIISAHPYLPVAN